MTKVDFELTLAEVLKYLFQKYPEGVMMNSILNSVPGRYVPFIVNILIYNDYAKNNNWTITLTNLGYDTITNSNEFSMKVDLCLLKSCYDDTESLFKDLCGIIGRDSKDAFYYINETEFSQVLESFDTESCFRRMSSENIGNLEQLVDFGRCCDLFKEKNDGEIKTFLEKLSSLLNDRDPKIERFEIDKYLKP